jgi:general stress protein 26
MADEKKTEAEKNEKLGELIKEIGIAMLTTVAADGHLRSRPMGYQHPRGHWDGKLYFFTHASTPKVDEVEHEHQVNVSFANPQKQDYVSVSGTARVSRDKAKMAELWNPFLKTWFPDGLEDPQIALLVIDVEAAEYWDSPSSAVVHLYGVVKATLTGTPPAPGENEKIDMSHAGTASRVTVAGGAL